jgi:hypothetical protein
VRSVAEAGLRWTREHAGTVSARPNVPAAVRLVAAGAPQLVSVSVARARHTRRWTLGRVGLLMAGAGELSTGFTLPHAGLWDLWLEGELMPSVQVAVDGRRLGSIAGQVGGTSLTQQVMTPLAIHLGAGPHTITITRAGAGLSPGGGGWSDLRAIFLTPAGGGAAPTLREASLGEWTALCGEPLQWVEAVPLSSARSGHARTRA